MGEIHTISKRANDILKGKTVLNEDDKKAVNFAEKFLASHEVINFLTSNKCINFEKKEVMKMLVFCYLANEIFHLEHEKLTLALADLIILEEFQKSYEKIDTHHLWIFFSYLEIINAYPLINLDEISKIILELMEVSNNCKMHYDDFNALLNIILKNNLGLNDMKEVFKIAIYALCRNIKFKDSSISVQDSEIVKIAKRAYNEGKSYSKIINEVRIFCEEKNLHDVAHEDESIPKENLEIPIDLEEKNLNEILLDNVSDDASTLEKLEEVVLTQEIYNNKIIPSSIIEENSESLVEEFRISLFDFYDRVYSNVAERGVVKNSDIRTLKSILKIYNFEKSNNTDLNNREKKALKIFKETLEELKEETDIDKIKKILQEGVILAEKLLKNTDGLHGFFYKIYDAICDFFYNLTHTCGASFQRLNEFKILKTEEKNEQGLKF
ncbi:MAG: hypothetical protein LBJ09_00800 [Clostridiales bacterium]|nr:hypothetical protein [Clostridiales bacterium]